MNKETNVFGEKGPSGAELFGKLQEHAQRTRQLRTEKLEAIESEPTGPQHVLKAELQRLATEKKKVARQLSEHSEKIQGADDHRLQSGAGEGVMQHVEAELAKKTDLEERLLQLTRQVGALQLAIEAAKGKKKPDPMMFEVLDELEADAAKSLAKSHDPRDPVFVETRQRLKSLTDTRDFLQNME